MIKKVLFAAFIFAAIHIVPAQAQFKNLGKMFEKAVDSTVGNNAERLVLIYPN